jgi:hypothetical protein
MFGFIGEARLWRCVTRAIDATVSQSALMAEGGTTSDRDQPSSRASFISLALLFFKDNRICSRMRSRRSFFCLSARVSEDLGVLVVRVPGTPVAGWSRTLRRGAGPADTAVEAMAAKRLRLIAGEGGRGGRGGGGGGVKGRKVLMGDRRSARATHFGLASATPSGAFRRADCWATGPGFDETAFNASCGGFSRTALVGRELADVVAGDGRGVGSFPLAADLVARFEDWFLSTGGSVEVEATG